MENKKCLVIYNPISGKGITQNTLDKYKEVLEEKGYQTEFVRTKGKNFATKIVEEAIDYDIVFSIGGDGTLNEIIKGNCLREEKLIVCPLPSGTCNDVATMLGYGKDPISNLEMALDGVVSDIDIGSINDNTFVYVVGMGKFINISYETNSKDKRKNGYMAYLKNFLVELSTRIKRYKAEVTVDGVNLDGYYSLILISNANHIAGINNFYKNVCLNDGKLEVLLCKSRTKKEFIKNFLGFLVGQKSNKIISMKAREVSIKLLDKLDKNWCIDGERYDYDGSEYSIKVHSKMKFLVPKINVKNLFKDNKN